MSLDEAKRYLTYAEHYNNLSREYAVKARVELDKKGPAEEQDMEIAKIEKEIKNANSKI